MLPFAPALLSITKFVLSRVAISSARMRAMVSPVPLPPGAGTMSWMGRPGAGHPSCASAGATTKSDESSGVSAAARKKRRSMAVLATKRAGVMLTRTSFRIAGLGRQAPAGLVGQALQCASDAVTDAGSPRRAGCMTTTRRRAVLGVASVVVAAAPRRGAWAASSSAKVVRVGFVLNSAPVATMTGPEPADPLVRAFVHALRERGYVEGRQLVLERRSAEGHLERLPALMRGLVASRVDVIVANGPAVRAALNATR